MSTKNDYIVRYKWLEEKCLEYKQENKRAHKKIQHLERLFSERNSDYQLYNDQVEHDTRLIKTSLDGIEGSYQKFMAIPNPLSYNDFYYKIMPEMCRYFAIFIRTIKTHVDFLQDHDYGPIFIQIRNKYHQELRERIGKVYGRYNRLQILMESTNWSTELDDNALIIRHQLKEWLSSATDILKQIEEQLTLCDTGNAQRTPDG